MAANYLLGKAERLMAVIPYPKNDFSEKHAPYSLDENKGRLLKKLPRLSAAIDKIADAACPGGNSVALMTIHPAYLAKSYFPTALLNATGLSSIGSRQRILVPDAPSAKRKRGDQETGLELFVAGPRSRFLDLPTLVSSVDSVSALAGEIVKIEDVRLHEPSSKIRVAPYEQAPTKWEAVLHASSSEQGNAILQSFSQFVTASNGEIDLARRMYSGGLCFVPVYGDRSVINAVAKFSFVRVLRGMPRIRPVRRTIGSSLTFDCRLPDAPAIDPNLRVAIFDGGPVDVDDLRRWVRNVKADGVGETSAIFREHAIGVTSASLFGPIVEGQEIERPFANIEVIQVLDNDTGKEHPDYFDVLRRIDSHLADNTYDFVNLSLGPDWPVEDEEPHGWTCVLDRRFYEKRTQMLAFNAVGNNGENDWSTGNARVQPPSDCVNAIAIGSCNSLGENWKRSSHSCIGFGRSPGKIRPELVAMGGDDDSPFFVVGTASGTAVPVIGTSYASPTAMRTAIGLRACLGAELQPMAIRALMINRAADAGLPMREVGWGRIQHSVNDLLISGDDTAHVIYQRTIQPGQWLSAEIPLPDEQLKGMVELSATICYSAPTEPENPINYTRAGLDVKFRPHAERFEIDKETQQQRKKPKTRPLFTLMNLYEGTESEMRDDAHKWETALHVREEFRGTSLKKPMLEIHYNAREGGAKTGADLEVAFALVVTVRCKKDPQLYNKIVNHYRGYLQQIVPIRVPAGRV